MDAPDRLERHAESGELVLVGHAEDELRRDDAGERVRHRAAPVGRDREVEPERATVADEPWQRIDERAEIDALERGGERGVPVEEDQDPRQRLGVRKLAVVGEREDAGAREQLLPALERLAEIREESLGPLLVLAADDRADVR